MMSNDLLKLISQHASYLYRASTTEVNETKKLIQRFSNAIARDLSTSLIDLSDKEKQALINGNYNTPLLKQIKENVDKEAKRLNDEYINNWTKSSTALIAYEIGYSSKLINTVQKGKDITINANRLLSQAMQKPINGNIASNIIERVTTDIGDKALNIIRQGCYNGLTNQDIIKSLRGTKQLNYKDSAFNTDKSNAERNIRTVRNHLSNQSYLECYEQRGVKKVIVVATLDGRTSKYCAAYDGTVYSVDEDYPKPPYHDNCRTVILPYFDDMEGMRPYTSSLKVKGHDGVSSFRPVGKMTKKQREDAQLQQGQISANTSYQTWFNNQDNTFQKEWLGSTRYKLYKEGNYSLERFVDPLNGKQYSLDELKALDSKTFNAVVGGD